MPQEAKILSLDEIKKLNEQQGLSLDVSGNEVYMIAFLVNAEQNHAGDPRPFKVNRQFLPKLVKSAIGRLWIPGKKDQELHIRDSTNTAEGILEYQKHFAGGQMVASFVNDETGNGNVIIRVFPEYRQAVLDKTIKPFVSPMIGNWKENDLGEIVDGEIIHLHSVNNGGYGDVAKVYGTCNGDFDKCARELIPLAAAGKLKEWRDSSCPCPKKFLNRSEPLGAMSMAQNGNATPSLETVAKDLDATKQELVSVRQEVSSLSTKIDAIAAKVGADAQDDQNQNTPAQNKMPVAAAGKKDQMVPLSVLEEVKADYSKQFDGLKKELDTIKKTAEDKAKEFALKERTRQAELIVKHQLITRKITPEQREAQIKSFLEMKDPNNPEQLRDLSLLAETASKAIEEAFPEVPPNSPIAAYGLNDDYGIGGDEDKTNYDSIEAEINGGSEL